jgi:hypothetical protein
MAIIHFTAEQIREALLPSITPEYTGAPNIRIVDAAECEGIACGKRLESALPSEDYARWLDSHAERPPVRPHSHLIVRGVEPETNESIFAIFRD